MDVTSLSSTAILPAGGEPPSLDSLSSALADKTLSGKNLEKAAKDFESVLLNTLVDEMKKTIDHSGPVEDSGFEQTQDMFWYFLSQDLGRRGGMGLWKQIVKQQSSRSASAKADKAKEPTL